MPFLAKYLKIGSLTGAGCLVVLLVILTVWAASALIWGAFWGLLVWNTFGAYHLFNHVFHTEWAGPVTFWQAVGAGAVISLVLG